MIFSLEAMREQYAALHSALGGILGEEERKFDDLAEQYAKPPRKYHTLEHIYWVLRRIDEMAAESRGHGLGLKVHEAEWDVVRWAAWYHDYRLTGAPDDERVSATWAVHNLPRAHPVEALHVKTMIESTAHDRVPLDYQCARLCDADLSILGADAEDFDQYESQVREEWANVPEELFRTARAVILRRFVDRPWIYMTDYGRTRWERSARQNLARSLAKLGSAVR